MRLKFSYILLFAAFCMWNIHLLYSVNSTLEMGLIPFRPEIQISKDGHITYAGERCALVIVTYCLYLITLNKNFLVFTLLFLGYLIDYVLYYNGTFFYLFNLVPASYTLIAAIVMLFIIVKSLFYD